MNMSISLPWYTVHCAVAVIGLVVPAGIYRWTYLQHSSTYKQQVGNFIVLILIICAANLSLSAHCYRTEINGSPVLYVG